MECSLCSLLTFVFGCIWDMLVAALDYPIVVFVLSFLIAIVFISNVHAAKLICEFGSSVAGSVGGVSGGGCGGGGGTCGAVGCTGSARNFDYSIEHGPHTWCCSDTNQSPINIVDDYVQKFPIRELLTWNHYDDLPSGVMMENNGHTVVVRACFSGNTPTLSGADLLASYTFVELCFRWSLLNSEGSEHMLNYRKFPMELQAMHRTGPMGECTSSYDLLMMAYFFEISSCNPYLEPIVQNLHRIKKPGAKVEIPPFPLSYLCHQFRTGFFSYGGSLTEPPCYQGAEWFVFPEPLAISERQLNEFRQLCSSDGQSRILRNSRPVQNLHCSRVVNLNQYNPLEAACQMAAAQELCGEPCEDEESC